MPRLDDELVLGFHIAEHDHFVVCDLRSGQDFSHHWHPSTNESIEAPLTCLLTIVRKVLHRMVRARASARKHWHGIETLFGSDKCVPRQPPTWAGTLHRSERRRSGFHAIGIR